MELVSKDLNKSEFESFTRPRIRISEDVILISDPPIYRRIFLFCFCLFLAILALLYKEGEDKVIATIVSFSFALAFLYDALSLQRVKMDLKEKMVYRTSLNPLENLVNHLLRRPSQLSFRNIEKIYSDYNVAFGGAAQRYYV
jgi:hypothetical protein